MKTSKRGLNFIKQWEGWSEKAYQDAAGKWTVGYGQTGPHITPHTSISREQGEAYLASHVEEVEQALEELIGVPLTQPQWDAVVSFSYNVGVRAFANSTLLRKLNTGNMKGAAKEFTRWVYAGGLPLRGLVLRRQAEKKLFEEG